MDIAQTAQDLSSLATVGWTAFADFLPRLVAAWWFLFSATSWQAGARGAPAASSSEPAISTRPCYR